MNLVDEGLAEIRPKDPKMDDFGNTITDKDNIVFIKKLEVGNTKTNNIKKLEKITRAEEKEEEE
jgi:hypothetical protein